MRSIGIDLEQHVKSGLLRFNVARPTIYGLEMHLVTMYDLIREFKPKIVILDPITDFFAVGSQVEVKAAITRIIDFLKSEQITALFTSYTTADDTPDQSVVGVSSLIDAWISLRNIENNGERHRGLFILKSRGMGHSNQIRSFRLTDHGIQIGEMDLAGKRNAGTTSEV
jgi:circadian clock protein KaiC